MVDLSSSSQHEHDLPCRPSAGEERALQLALSEQDARPAAPTVGPGLLRPIAVNSTAALEAAVPGCRMVSTFKYRFDGFFSISQEGMVNGTTSVLLVRVVGRKDIHMQLVSSIPPASDDIYEASEQCSLACRPGIPSSRQIYCFSKVR